jgi:Tfp pilus assembly protein PilN
MRAVNLIPSEQRAGASVGAGRSEGVAYAVLALIAGFALLAFLYGSAHHQVSSRRAQAASLTAQAARAQSAAEQLAPYTSFIAMREQRTQAVASLAESRFDWAHVFHEFGRVLPRGTTISALGGTIAGASTDSASASGATPAGSIPTFTLSGCATSQPTVALTLQRLRLIDGVKEVTLQSSQSGSGATSSGDGCTGRDATFAATVVFAPLPASTAVAAAAKTVADSTGAASTSASSTSAVATTSTESAK